jgi:hypothetical protein
MGRSIGILIVFGIVLVIIVFVALALGSALPGDARDLGQWEDSDPAVKAWFQALLQPDTIVPGTRRGTSCCGEADAYYVDVSVQRDQVIATISDDRDDEKLRRQHEENGTPYVVPPNKIVGAEQRAGNPTGRAVLFLGTTYLVLPGAGLETDRSKPRQVLCFVDNSAF